MKSQLLNKQHSINKHPAVELQDVSLTLRSQAGEINILRNINLSLAKGEAVSLVGPSGSGKTSLIMIIAGLQQATQGKVTLFNQDITHWSEEKLTTLRRDSIGIVFQGFHLLPAMTALENVAVPLELSGTANARNLAKEALDQVGLSHRMDHYPGQLSGGEQQRVALARSFAPRPGLLLADEPTGNLDQENGNHVIELMHQLHQDYDTTLLLITHDKKLAKSCQRTLTLQNGTLQ